VIVNLVENGWQIIYHRAHALLAAQIAGQWNRKNCPIRLYETVAAISHHDDLEREWEGDQLTPAGAPLDFQLDTHNSLDKLKELTTNSLYRGRWVALLISMHVSYLNEAKRGESEELDQFLDQQLENQKRWQEELKVSPEEAEKAYAFFQWCDRLSLILCQDQLPDDERFLEISKGPDGKRYDVMQRRDNLVTVQPWPFEDEKFTVNVEACYLDQIKFENNDAFKSALKSAPRQLIEWTFIQT
jgi:hypothetical protein